MINNENIAKNEAQTYFQDVLLLIEKGETEALQKNIEFLAKNIICFSGRAEECIVHACRHGQLDILNLFLPYGNSSGRDNQALMWAAFHGHPDIVNRLLEVEPKDHNTLGEALSWAAQKNHKSVLGILIPLVTPKEIAKALKKAAAEGQTECLKQLISVCPPELITKHSLILAAEKGHVEALELLAPFIDEDDFGEAFLGACDMEHIEAARFLAEGRDINKHMHAHFSLLRAAEKNAEQILRFVLQYADPKENDSEALRIASKKRFREVFDLLYPLSDAEGALSYMAEEGSTEKQKTLLLERLTIDRSKHDLLQATISLGQSKDLRVKKI